MLVLPDAPTVPLFLIMPPQLGAFAIPYSAQHKGRPTPNAEIVEVGTLYQHQPTAGPSRIHRTFIIGPSRNVGNSQLLRPENGNGSLTEEAKRDKRRKLRRKRLTGNLGLVLL